MKQSDTLETLRQRSSSKIRLDLRDGIPLVVKYGYGGQSYTLEDGEFACLKGRSEILEKKNIHTQSCIQFLLLLPFPFSFACGRG